MSEVYVCNGCGEMAAREEIFLQTSEWREVQTMPIAHDNLVGRGENRKFHFCPSCMKKFFAIIARGA